METLSYRSFVERRDVQPLIDEASLMIAELGLDEGILDRLWTTSPSDVFHAVGRFLFPPNRRARKDITQAIFYLNSAANRLQTNDQDMRGNLELFINNLRRIEQELSYSRRQRINPIKGGVHFEEPPKESPSETPKFEKPPARPPKPPASTPPPATEEPLPPSSNPEVEEEPPKSDNPAPKASTPAPKVRMGKNKPGRQYPEVSGRKAWPILMRRKEQQTIALAIQKEKDVANRFSDQGYAGVLALLDPDWLLELQTYYGENLNRINNAFSEYPSLWNEFVDRVLMEKMGYRPKT